MITAIVFDMGGDTKIRRYDTDDPFEAKRLFIREWIEGKITWDHFEFYGPQCTVTVPAFSPEFLEDHCLSDESNEGTYLGINEGVHVWEWLCITGIHGSDEHIVKGFFVPHLGLDHDHWVN